MTEFLQAAACFILAMVALGLLQVLRGSADVDRMMAAQLLGTGGIAVVLLTGAAAGQALMIDVALILALLAAFAGLAFVNSPDQAGPAEAPEDDAG